MDHKVVTEFREILRVFERELDRQNNSSCCCGVTLSQCHVLMELSKTDNISLNQLATQLAVDKSAASRTVEHLVEKKMVSRSIPKEDRRTTMLGLTRTGTQVCKQINDGNNDYYEKALRSVPEDDLAVFLRSFEAIASHMSMINRGL
jgi:DNA-binding MarR family transcriptional regulator